MPAEAQAALPPFLFCSHCGAEKAAAEFEPRATYARKVHVDGKVALRVYRHARGRGYVCRPCRMAAQRRRRDEQRAEIAVARAQQADVAALRAEVRQLADLVHSLHARLDRA